MTVPLEELLKNISSRFYLVLTAAQRASELAQGAPPLIVTKSKKPAVIALEEITKGKVHCEIKKSEKKS